MSCCIHLCSLAVVVACLAPGCAGSRSAVTSVNSVEPSNSSTFAHVSRRDDQSVNDWSEPPVTVAGENQSSERSEIELTTATDEASLPHSTLVPPEALRLASIGEHHASSWTLASLEAAALENNPAIRQASASAHKAVGFRDQVGMRPNPTIGYNGTQLADRGTDQHIIFVEQDFVSAGKLSRNQAVLNQEVQSQLWEVEAQRYRVLTDVRQRYYQALAAQRRLQLATQFHVIAVKGVEVARARVDAKEGSIPDVLQAEIQLDQVKIQQRQADAAFRGEWNQLMAVAGLNGVSPGILDGTLPSSVEITDMQSIKGVALESSPELQAARARVARARANIERQEVQAIPNLSFQLAAGVDNSTNSGMINAQVGLPIPVFNKNQGNIAAAHAELSRACQDLRRIERSIESRMARGAQEYESAAAAVEQYQQQIIPKAQQTLSLSEEAYAAGEFGFLQVLVARRTYFESNLEFVVAQSNLAQAEAYLQGLALSGGLNDTPDTGFDSGLRDQSLSGQ